ncbi:hypothetical protein AAG612_07980 [Citromicrobium bathyomarinum]|uniref:glycosyl-4,4'-diaponeurosporenoate acyltransferase CrtO family protein n=1 Tax=Citromicrobium bathyomarinum TaxID=72174 RepID=UPI003159D75A
MGKEKRRVHRMDGHSAAARRLADRLNLLPIAVFCLWLAAFALFWGQAHGPLRSFDTPPPGMAAWPWFAASILGAALVLALPEGFYRLRGFERSGRLHEALGAKAFRAFVTNGDHINRIVTRRYRDYRVYPHGEVVAAAARTARQSERSHLVCLIAGLVACFYAALIGWWGWAGAMLVANVLGNLYPVLVQRHTRARLRPLEERDARRQAATRSQEGRWR